MSLRGYSSGAAFLCNLPISSPYTVRLRYQFLVETEMIQPLTLTNHSYTTESQCRVESSIDGLGCGITDPGPPALARTTYTTTVNVTSDPGPASVGAMYMYIRRLVVDYKDFMASKDPEVHPRPLTHTRMHLRAEDTLCPTVALLRALLPNPNR